MQNEFVPNFAVFGDLLSKAISGGDFEVRADQHQAALEQPDSILTSPWSIFYAALVRGWPAHLISDQYRQLQPTDVETLLVSGNLDFSTPPQFATNELLPYLHNRRQIILKDFGHEPVNFDVGIGWPGMAKVALGSVGALIALLAALVWFATRR